MVPAAIVQQTVDDLSQRFERGEGLRHPDDEVGGRVKLADAEIGTRVGWMQVGRLLASQFFELGAERSERTRKPRCAGPRTRRMTRR